MIILVVGSGGQGRKTIVKLTSDPITHGIIHRGVGLTIGSLLKRHSSSSIPALGFSFCLAATLILYSKTNTCTVIENRP